MQIDAICGAHSCVAESVVGLAFCRQPRSSLPARASRGEVTSLTGFLRFVGQMFQSRTPARFPSYSFTPDRCSIAPRR